MEHQPFLSSEELKAAQKTEKGYILENGVEIEDTFAGLFHHNETPVSRRSQIPFF